MLPGFYHIWVTRKHNADSLDGTMAERTETNRYFCWMVSEAFSFTLSQLFFTTVL